MNRHRNTLNLFSAIAVVALVALGCGRVHAAEAGGRKLLVYVLAGQSNMQGHAEVSTLAYLPKPAYVPSKEEWAMLTGGLDRTIRLKSETSIREGLLKDPANAKLAKKELGELVLKALAAETEKVRNEGYEEFRKRQADPARAARDKELSAVFTPRLTDQIVLDTAAATKGMKGTSLDLATEWERMTGVPVGKHTYIAAYGGVSRGEEPGVATGPLSTGYGARPTAFGPEYAFGMMLEKALDQPVLIIKTAWGGKSLHYDFRPPSAGTYQLTANEKDQLEKWKAKKEVWDKYIAGGGSPAAMVQMDKDINSQNRKRSLQQAIAKLPKEQQAAELGKVAAMTAEGKGLRDKLVPPPGDMPAHDDAGFYWKEMIGFIQKVLADPKAYHPEYDPEAGFEVAGGLWFQGFNDQFDPEFYGNYSSNMVHFIQDLRREVKQPRMPFVIGVLGTPAFREEALANKVAMAQREAARAPELAGTVTAVESWPLTTPEVAIWRMKKDAARGNGDAAEIQRTEQQWPLYGSNQGYHYDGSGRFFIRLGDEFATAMLKLMGK